MVKQIFNWTTGSFFRTIGRIIAYIVIGGLIGYLLNQVGIDLFNIMFTQVNASELKVWSYSKSQIAEDIEGNITFGSWYDTPHNFYPTYPVERIRYILKTSDGFSTENTYNFTWGFQPNPDSLGIKYVKYWKNGQDDITNSFTCNNFYINDYGYYLTDCSFNPPSEFSSSDELWITIGFNESYVDSLRTYVYGYDERLGTNAVITNSSNNIINNQNNNTSSIINNNNQNTQSIINNQNNNTQAQIDSQMVCNYIDKKNIAINNYYLYIDGRQFENASHDYGITDYIKIDSKSKLQVLEELTSSVNPSSCFYNVNKTLISCVFNSTLINNSFLTIPSDASFVRFSINFTLNKPQFKICKNGNQAMQDTLEDTDTDSESNEMSDFINDFTLDSEGGISDLFTIPIDFLEDILVQESTANLCTTFRGKNICLPSGNILWGSTRSCNMNTTLCDSSVNLSSFRTLFSILVGGYLYYKMIRSLIYTSNDIFNPDKDKVEVMDL